MQKTIILTILLAISLQVFSQPAKREKEVNGKSSEKTTFQTSNPWKPVTDVRADVAIVYSVKDHHGKGEMTFEERVQTWRDKGYTTHFMSGIAWENTRIILLALGTE